MRSVLLLVLGASIFTSAPAAAPYDYCNDPTYAGDGDPVGIFWSDGVCHSEPRILMCNALFPSCKDVEAPPVDKLTPCREAGLLCPP